MHAVLGMGYVPTLAVDYLMNDEVADPFFQVRPLGLLAVEHYATYGRPLQGLLFGLTARLHDMDPSSRVLLRALHLALLGVGAVTAFRIPRPYDPSRRIRAAARLVVGPNPAMQGCAVDSVRLLGSLHPALWRGMLAFALHLRLVPRGVTAASLRGAAVVATLTLGTHLHQHPPLLPRAFAAVRATSGSARASRHTARVVPLAALAAVS
ncbi:MAG: hypothetical protein IPM29_19495 [Planctomycetes bacterium]|nr:hypothetical protein [Planctomycetota bacterium]